MKILIISGGSIDEMWGRKWVADYEPDYCIAADSGLVMADKLGLTVDLLLGDYDSVDKKIFEKYNGNTKTITYPCEKDYTDTHLALKKAIEKIKKLQDTSKDGTEDEIAIIGATGTRYDHAFTNIFVLDESLEAGIRCAIYDKNNKIYLADKSFEIRKGRSRPADFHCCNLALRCSLCAESGILADPPVYSLPLRSDQRSGFLTTDIPVPDFLPCVSG